MSDAQSILDQMTAGVMERKAKGAARLTPVGTETGAALAAVQTIRDAGMFAPDQGHDLWRIGDDLDQIEQAVARIRSTIAPVPQPVEQVVLDISEAPTEAVAQVKAQSKAQKQADFDAMFAAKSAKMQADAYGVPPAEVSANGWVCPIHEDASLTTLTSRRGRVYRACVECEAFEK